MEIFSNFKQLILYPLVMKQVASLILIKNPKIEKMILIISLVSIVNQIDIVVDLVQLSLKMYNQIKQPQVNFKVRDHFLDLLLKVINYLCKFYLN